MNFKKLQDAKSIHRNHLHFYILRKKYQKDFKKIKDSIPFTTATKRIKYIGINLYGDKRTVHRKL